MLRFAEATPLRRFFDRAFTQPELGVKGGPTGPSRGDAKRSGAPFTPASCCGPRSTLDKIARWDVLTHRTGTRG
jgi:hypothetical protein